jgi:PRC-barrel domain
MKLLHAALLAIVAAAPSPAAADIDASLADARLVGMPIYTYDGLLIGQVTGVETYGSNRSIVAAVGGLMGFWPRSVWIPLNWADKEDQYIKLLLTSAQVAAFLGPGAGIGSR